MIRKLYVLVGCCSVAWCLGCSGDTTSPTSPSLPPPPPESTAVASPPSPPPTPEPPPQPRTLRTAMFQGANGYRTSGTASIVREGSDHRLELGDDFRTDNSVALDVWLCTNDSCAGEVLDLGPLQRLRGKQSYGLSNAANAYSHVVIWCRAVRLPFGSGRLR